MAARGGVEVGGVFGRGCWWSGRGKTACVADDPKLPVRPHELYIAAQNGHPACGVVSTADQICLSPILLIKP